MIAATLRCSASALTLRLRFFQATPEIVRRHASGTKRQRCSIPQDKPGYRFRESAVADHVREHNRGEFAMFGTILRHIGAQWNLGVGVYQKRVCEVNIHSTNGAVPQGRR